MSTRLAPLVMALALTATPVQGQSAIYGAGLQAWTGCWSAEQTLVPAGVVRLVCITPTANVNVANVATIDGSNTAHETIDATGRTVALDARGCTGTRRTAWSRDSRRLFLRTTGVCQGVPLATSTMFTISTSGEWIQIEGSAARGGTGVRVARYRDAGVPASLRPDVARAVEKDGLARESTRAAFGAPVHLEDVIEALGLVEADVVAAWVREHAQRFDVTRSALAQLDLSGLPPRVTDALTAIADSNAVLARASGDSSSYGRDSDADPSASDSTLTDDDLPLGYGGGFDVPAPSQRGRGAHGDGTRGGKGRRGPPLGTSGGTVRLGGPRH